MMKAPASLREKFSPGKMKATMKKPGGVFGKPAASTKGGGSSSIFGKIKAMQKPKTLAKPPKPSGMVSAS
jgi:hypothetical protein